MKKYFLILLTVIVSSNCIKKQTSTSVNADKATECSACYPSTEKFHLSKNWYPSEQQQLSKQIDEYFEQALTNFYVETNAESVKALIVPHASLHYSGLCAAAAYQTLLPAKSTLAPDNKNKKINHVIICAPDHTGLTYGISLPSFKNYQTPLGTIPVNEKSIRILAQSKLCKVNETNFSKEHSLEMQLPFLQKTIDSFSITPLLIGNIDKYDIDSFSSLLRKVISENTLVVISSDFIHHGPRYRYNLFNNNICYNIRSLDSLILEPILKQSLPEFTTNTFKTEATICGKNAISILLSMLNKKIMGTLSSRLCCYYTSAHMEQAYKNQHNPLLVDTPTLLGTIPDHLIENSVSYAGIVFTAQSPKSLSLQNQLTMYEKKSLITLARDTIANELSLNKQPKSLLWPIITPSLEEAQGVFISIHDHENSLKGRIGSFKQEKPLYQAVQDFALAAAFNDQRFTPITEPELCRSTLTLSILSAPQKVSSYKDIQLGKHGIILHKLKADDTLLTSAVFLPQVPLALHWTIEKTLEELCLSAELEANSWKEKSIFEVFESYDIQEKTESEA